MKANAVFEGGGVRGIGIVGALTYLEGRGYSWQKVAGASVGAVIAALIAAGYTADEMKRILMETNFLKFMDKDRLQSIPLLGKPISFLTQNAIYSGDYVEKWLGFLLHKKGVSTFRDISENGESPLKIVASDITRKCTVVLPDALSLYDVNPMDFPIARAVRMSISIPFYFKPVKLRYKNNISYIMDGCVSCSYPINIFDTDTAPEFPTFGFKFLEPKSSYTSMGKTDPLSVLFDIAGTMTHKSTTENMSDKNKSRSIIIPTAGVETTDFDISREKSLTLYKYGFRSAMEFLKYWNFEEYLSKYANSPKETDLFDISI